MKQIAAPDYYWASQDCCGQIDMLTVIQCLPALNHGGVERGTLEVAEALVTRGHRSIVVSAGGSLVPQLLQTGSEHVCLPIGRKSVLTLQHIPALRRLLRNTGADILHARSRLPAWISYFAWRGMDRQQRPAFITTVHGAYSVNRYSRIMTYGERVIAVSEFIREYILEHYPDTDPGKIITIPRGISPHAFPYRFHPDRSWLSEWKKLGLSGCYLITLPGRITRRKGLEDFIALINRLKHDGLNVHGLVAGGADRKNRPFYETMLNQVKSIGADRFISFLGPRNDLREIMSVSSLVTILAKKPESFGRTALESLSLGIPVVAYDRGGSSEILGQIFPRGLIEPDNLDQAVALVKQFINTPPQVPPQHSFTLQQMLDKTLNVYQALARTI
jgi:glycosyltransferase involved in cell wall biosynthesis